MAPHVDPHAFWAGKRVLLAGHLGLVGSGMALWLRHPGAQAAWCLPPTVAPRVLPLDGAFETLAADPAGLSRLIGTIQPQIVVHLAGMDDDMRAFTLRQIADYEALP